MRIPSWYQEGDTVPTWNYVAVHAYGCCRVVEDRDCVLDILRRSVLAYESPRPEPWTFDGSDKNVDMMIKEIIGFTIEITRLEGKWKLSQNHPEARRRRVVDGLKAQPDQHS